MSGSITDVPGIKVGHWTNSIAATGCTVVLCEGGMVAGVDVRGSAPGTRETDLLRPTNLVQEAHAVLLSGGSAFGLDAAAGVMRYLEERGYGYDTGVAKVPIVPGAILFDLALGRADVRPGPEQGYHACLQARAGPVAEGSVGAGTGATVGKLLGMAQATKGGLGTASQRVREKVVVGALVAVNCLGDVVHPDTGQVLAGPRRPDGPGFLSTTDLLRQGTGQWTARPNNTVIGVVATSAALTKEQANKLAQMASAGLARTIRPVHTMFDGDVIFALSVGGVGGAWESEKGWPGEVTTLGAVAAEVVAEAVIRAITQARSLGGVPAASEVT